MRTVRAILFPRENVPLAVHSDTGSGLESASLNHDLWRETDRFMRTPEFTQPMTRRLLWKHRRTTWEMEEGDY